ncbi:MAG: hypothetical protein HOC79_05805 [Euryarchaeota archaeon]|nr:hypothetical protein [Euryarchaeota archaeon]MBT4407372.1 hypothetical protein [Euryarchaeota archaeon]
MPERAGSGEANFDKSLFESHNSALQNIALFHSSEQKVPSRWVEMTFAFGSPHDACT